MKPDPHVDNYKLSVKEKVWNLEWKKIFHNDYTPNIVKFNGNKN